MRWRMLSLMVLFIAVAHFNRVSISIAGAEHIIASGFVSATQMGLVYSAFLLFYTLFMIPGGWFIDRCGPRAGWMIVGFGSAAGALLTGLTGLALTTPATLLAGLLVVRSLMGCSNAPLHPTGARLVANWIPPADASQANGLLNCAACAGMAATPFAFGLLSDAVGWPRTFAICGGVTAVIALVWTLTAADYPPKAAAPEPPQTALPPALRLLQLLGNRRLLCLTFSYALVGYFQYLFMYWPPYYFEHELKWSKQTARLGMSILLVAMGTGMVVGGWLADRAPARFGPRLGLAVVPVAGLVLGAVATFLGVLSAGPLLIIGCFATAMAAVGLSEGSFWTAAVRQGGVRGGTAAAILNTGGNAGGLLAPVLTPEISKQLGWGVSLGLASVVCLLAAALWWGVIPAAHEEKELP